MRLEYHSGKANTNWLRTANYHTKLDVGKIIAEIYQQQLRYTSILSPVP